MIQITTKDVSTSNKFLEVVLAILNLERYEPASSLIASGNYF